MPTRSLRSGEPSLALGASAHDDAVTTREAVGRCVGALSRNERLLLCLRYADGLSDEEIAVLTRSTARDVTLLLDEIVQRVRAMLTLTAAPR